MENYSDEGFKSVFNAGVAMAERIDSLQRVINTARFNITSYNPDVSRFNYEVWISAIDSLLNEAWAKLTGNEKEAGEKIRALVVETLKWHPPMIRGKNGDYKFNKDNMERLMRLVDIYEKNVKVYLDNHDLNNPNKDDDDDEGY